MVWAADRTQTLNNVNSVVYQELMPWVMNLLTEGESKEFRVMAARGAIEPFSGGDEFHVPVMIKGIGAHSDIAEYDPATANPTNSLSTTGQQVLARAFYKIYSRTQNIPFNQGILRIGGGPLAVMDALSQVYKAYFMDQIQGMLEDDSDLKGLWYTTAVNTTAGHTNFKTMVADTTTDVAGVDVDDEGTEFVPELVNASNSNGTNLVAEDLQKLYNQCDRGMEGGITDWFTMPVVWQQIRKNMYSDAVLGLPSIASNVGMQNTIPFADTLIHHTRHATKSTAWDVTDATTSENPLLGIDMSNFGMRIVRGGREPGDEYAFIYRVGGLDKVQAEPKLYQRVEATYQYYFKRSRRTSGSIEGLDL